jgi:hypothetical protein
LYKCGNCSQTGEIGYDTQAECEYNCCAGDGLLGPCPDTICDCAAGNSLQSVLNDVIP